MDTNEELPILSLSSETKNDCAERDCSCIVVGLKSKKYVKKRIRHLSLLSTNLFDLYSERSMVPLGNRSTATRISIEASRSF